MGNYIEVNDTLQITLEQGFPSDILNLDCHQKNPVMYSDLEGKEFEFLDKPRARIFHLDPVRVFLVENIDGKWLFWGKIVGLLQVGISLLTFMNPIIKKPLHCENHLQEGAIFKMNYLYKKSDRILVPDGTFLQPIIGANISQKLGIKHIKGCSLAVGILPPGKSTSIHIHPVCLHLAWVISGELTAYMKDVTSDSKYCLTAGPEEVITTEPMTFLQLANESDSELQILYICAPEFIYEVDGDQVVYNDAVVLEETWDELEKANWELKDPLDIRVISKNRDEALARLIKH
jgi:uncharacterized cupin superfamily protein